MLGQIGFGQYDFSRDCYPSRGGCSGPILCHQKRESHQLLPLEGAIPINHSQGQENIMGLFSICYTPLDQLSTENLDNEL